MRVRSVLVAAFLLAGAAVIAVAATQMRGAPSDAPALQQAVNENSAGRLLGTPDLPVVTVEEPW